MSRALIEVRRSRAPWRGARLGTGGEAVYCLHHETRIGHTGHPHAGARHAVHLPRARRRAGGGGRAARSWWGCAVLVPFGHRQAVVSWWRSKRRAPRRRKGQARNPRKRRMKRINGLSAPNTRTPARAPAVRMPASTWQAQAHRARAVQAVLRRGRRRVRAVALRTLPGAALVVRAPVHRRPAAFRAWCAAREGYWRLEEPAVGEVDDRWVVPGPAFGSFEPRKNAVKQGIHRGGLALGRAARGRADRRVRRRVLAAQGAGASGRRACEASPQECAAFAFRLPACLPAGQAAFTPSPKPALTPGRPRRCAS